MPIEGTTAPLCGRNVPADGESISQIDRARGRPMRLRRRSASRPGYFSAEGAQYAEMGERSFHFVSFGVKRACANAPVIPLGPLAP